MIYHLDFTDDAKEEIADLKKSAPDDFDKVSRLLKELVVHPRTGTGKPELMKYGKLKGLWSRRITDKNRLVYKIKDSELIVVVLSAKGHYNDK